MTFKFTKARPRRSDSLSDLRPGEKARVRDLRLPKAIADHLLRLGLLPGAEVTLSGSGPGGDPKVYQVDGCEVALRRETARHIVVTPMRLGCASGDD
jgi:ferrous iron transport protein A